MSIVQIGNEQVQAENNKQQQLQQKQQRQSQPFWGWIYRNVTVQRLEGAAMVAVTTAALIAIGRRYRRGKDAQAAPSPAPRTFQRSLTLAAFRGGRSILRRVLDAQHFRVETAFLKAKAELLSKLSSTQAFDFNELERLVVRMEMSGKEDEAVKILQEAKEKALTNRKIHEAYELEMLVVEMLICQGDTKSAQACKCLEDNEISDARRPLYKAVIEVMEGNIDKAKKTWIDFLEKRALLPTCEEEQDLPAALYDFEEFRDVIKSLKTEIEEIHQETSKP
ncbi:uncharacterized protein [Aristolochia californica]|uniref:uncharacterized protein n=1 Tax=Aristolochia californica TaxID=171875 RepID=UPI0035DCE6F8